MTQAGIIHESVPEILIKNPLHFPHKFSAYFPLIKQTALHQEWEQRQFKAEASPIVLILSTQVVTLVPGSCRAL